MASAPGCAFSEGDPWGLAEVTFEAYMAPPPSRLTDEGHLKTSSSYAIQIDSLMVAFDAVTLRIAGAQTATFDPADPPPGYSLCHNGHCHKDDGTLPTYEEIIAELGIQGGGGAVAIPVAIPELAISATPTAVTLGDCPNGCTMERASLTGIEVLVKTVTLKGRVFDQLPPETARLPAEGVAVDLTLPLDLRLFNPVDVSFAPGERVGARFPIVLSIPPTVLDGVDWALPEDTTDTAVSEAFAENLLASPESFSVFVERFDP